MASSRSNSDTFSDIIEGTEGVPKLLVTIGIAIVVIAGAVAFYLGKSDAKSEAANQLLYQAKQSLDQETQAWVGEATKAAPSPAKGAKAPAKQPPAEDPLYKKADVEATFPKSLRNFQAVIASYPGSRAAFEAQLSIGELFYDHGQPEKAIGWYEKAADSAPDRLDQATALSSLGYAREEAGHPAEAIQAYEKAVNLGQAVLKGDLLLAIARNYEAQKDVAKAKSTYDQILGQMPNSEAAKKAELLKAHLQ